MKHPETLPGGRNANHSVNNNNLNNQISKRSNIMKATTFFRTGLVAIISLLFLVSTLFAGDLKNTGTLKNKAGKTTTVSGGNLVNSGTVQNAGIVDITNTGSFVNSATVDNFIASSQAGTIKVADSYRQTAGSTINQGGASGAAGVGTIEVTDSLAIASGTLATDSGRVAFIGTTQLVPAFTYGTLAILGSGDHTLIGNVVVNDSIRINSTLKISTFTLTDSATNATLTDGSGILDGGTGTVIYAKNANQNVFPSTLYNNLSLTGSTGNHNKTATGAVTVKATGTLLTGAKDSLDVTGAFTLTSGSTLNNSGGIKLGGSATIAPTTVTSPGTFVYYANAATQTIAAFTYKDLFIRNVTGGTNAKSIVGTDTVGIKQSLKLENVTSPVNVSIAATATVDYLGNSTDAPTGQDVAALNYGILAFKNNSDKLVNGAITAVSVTNASSVNSTNGLWIQTSSSLTTTGAAGFVNDGMLTNDGTITVQ